jgi:hypothetical protein
MPPFFIFSHKALISVFFVLQLFDVMLFLIPDGSG